MRFSSEGVALSLGTRIRNTDKAATVGVTDTPNVDIERRLLCRFAWEDRR